MIASFPRHIGVILSALLLAGCGSITKVQSSGAVDLARLEHGQKMAPVLMQYKILVPAGGDHELVFIDQDKNRFSNQVPAATETTSGVIVYLPADRLYALAGMAMKLNGPESRAFSFGSHLNLFRIKAGTVNVLPYFEITIHDGGQLNVNQALISHSGEAKRKFGSLTGLNPINVKLTEP